MRRWIAFALLFTWWIWTTDVGGQSVKFKGPYSDYNQCVNDAKYLNEDLPPNVPHFWCE